MYKEGHIHGGDIQMEEPSYRKICTWRDTHRNISTKGQTRWYMQMMGLTHRGTKTSRRYTLEGPNIQRGNQRRLKKQTCEVQGGYIHMKEQAYKRDIHMVEYIQDGVCTQSRHTHGRITEGVKPYGINMRSV